ncbi:MAG TPA: hypothetical protein VGB64_05655 [Actinomycetota bacterium]
MRRLALVALLAAVGAAGPAPARAEDSVAAIRVAVPHGPVSIGLGCTVAPVSAHGAWIAVFAVDADSTGFTESSVTALGWWDHGRLDVMVRTSGFDITAPPVEVATIGERYRISLAASWGGAHRTWAATLRAGCGATDGSITDVGAVVDGRDVTEFAAAARIVTAGPGEFGEALAAQGATLVRGVLTVEAPYLLGVFSARAGSIAATAPDGSVTRESGMYPSIPVRSGFGGTWRFDASPAVSDDPYLLTALAFDEH